MKKSKSIISQNVFDALTINADLVLVSGSNKQTYSMNYGTFEDDRKWVPCVVGGYANVEDPANVMNGDVSLSDIEWYTQTPIEGDFATGRITNPSDEILEDVDVYDPNTGELIHEAAWRSEDFLISDGSDSPWCQGVQRNFLIVHKNVPHSTAISIYAYLKFDDTRTGTSNRILRSYDFMTTAFDDEVLVMKGCEGAEFYIDPIALPDTVPSGQDILSIPWNRKVFAQLTGIDGNVADNKSCYLWVIQDTTATIGWREFTDDEKIIYGISGDKTKELTFDARMLKTAWKVRCYGCRRDEGAAWINPLSDNNPYFDYSLAMTMAKKLVYEPKQKTGSSQTMQMDVPCNYEMQFIYNGKPVPQTKKCLFLVNWKVKDLRTGVVHNMGFAPNLQFVPCYLGLDYRKGFYVWGEIYEYDGCVPVVHGGKYVVHNDNVVISPTYK